MQFTKVLTRNLGIVLPLSLELAIRKIILAEHLDDFLLRESQSPQRIDPVRRIIMKFGVEGPMGRSRGLLPQLEKPLEGRRRRWFVVQAIETLPFTFDLRKEGSVNQQDPLNLATNLMPELLVEQHYLCSAMKTDCLSTLPGPTSHTPPC